MRGSAIHRMFANSGPGSNGCTEWKGGTDKKGYGRIWTPEGNRGVHRISYAVFVGPIPDGLMVLHHCDNPPCWEPTHLFVGTAKDNADDRDRKGRWAGGGGRAYGAANGNARLSDDEVEAIRSAPGPTTEVAKRFGVSRTMAHYIRSGERRSKRA